MIGYLHTMVRVTDIDASLKFFCDGLGLAEIKRYDNEAGRFTLVFLGAPDDIGRFEKDNQLSKQSSLPEGLPMVELTYNWPNEDAAREIYTGGRNFGHLAYRVENIYQACERFQNIGVEINRPPRDGRMAFIKSPDGISVELIQRGDPLPLIAPWKDMDNIGNW